MGLPAMPKARCAWNGSGRLRTEAEVRGGEGDQFQQVALPDAVLADEADEVGVGVELDRRDCASARSPSGDLHQAEIAI
jgi:hypothetical protein